MIMTPLPNVITLTEFNSILRTNRARQHYILRNIDDMHICIGLRSHFSSHSSTKLPLYVLFPPITFLISYSLSPWPSLYLLTPWCRVLLEKPTGLQLVKKFPAFHKTRRFITALTSVRHLSLSWASPIQSIYPHPTS